ncbi:hypothetical protein VPH35_082326 [Triticum aestivum]
MAAAGRGRPQARNGRQACSSDRRTGAPAAEPAVAPVVRPCSSSSSSLSLPCSRPPPSSIDSTSVHLCVLSSYYAGTRRQGAWRRPGLLDSRCSPRWSMPGKTATSSGDKVSFA